MKHMVLQSFVAVVARVRITQEIVSLVLRSGRIHWRGSRVGESFSRIKTFGGVHLAYIEASHRVLCLHKPLWRELDELDERLC